MSALRKAIVLLALGFLGQACDSRRVELVAEEDDKAADFGRRELVDAIVEFSATPKSAQAYAKFAARVEELSRIFNREVREEAELRLGILAIPPLQAGMSLPPAEQMDRFATTVWPTILDFPAAEGETADEYARRLCLTELALACNNIVPEYWPEIINARVWRALQSRVEVAYDRCLWCAEDPTFAKLLRVAREGHLKVELIAQEARERGRASAWPKAGKGATPLATSAIVRFGVDGWVTVNGRPAPGGKWREAIKELHDGTELIALHMRPERLVGELLQVLGDIREAGFQSVALVVREPGFPYQAQQYVVDADTRSFRDLGVKRSDTIQILVQALDLKARRAAGQR